MTRSRFSTPFVFILLLASCSGLLQPTPVPTTTTIPSPIPPKPMITGRVIDIDGNPIQGASVASRNCSTTSDNDGWFKLSSSGVPEWITVQSIGYISRVRAAAPGIPILYRLSPDDGKTIVIHFVGDTMFGRRFYDPNEDGDTSDGLLPPNPDVAAHLKLLEQVKPLLENADFTVVNFESTLSHEPHFSPRDPRPEAFHSTAPYVYASHTNSVMALKQAGVDIVDLGNNHNYDLLEAGLDTSLSTFDQVGLLHFGAGKDEASAWDPLIISSKGQKIAFVGCTTVRIPSDSVTKTDVPYVASDALKKGGAAFCTDADLRSAVLRAKQQADIVITMLHGGLEYIRTPTDKIIRLTEVARQAGATLVINHHPHVVGGFALKDQSLIAWTIGNFLFDQTVWPSFESYLVAVYLREGKVIRAYVEPLIIDGYLPYGLTDDLADYVVRGAAGREPGPFIMESGAMEVDLNGHSIRRDFTKTMDGGSETSQIIAVPQSQWISNFSGTGKLVLGRDLLWIGAFENAEVDAAARVPPLWDLVLGGVQAGQDYAYEGNAGIRLARGSSNILDVVTTNLHRLRVNPGTQLSITGMMRAMPETHAVMQISWYADTLGSSFLQTDAPILVESPNQWQSFRFDAQAPSEAIAVQIFLRLVPPSGGAAAADFDNIRVIEWANRNARYSPLYNYALLTGSGDVTFTQEVLPGAEQWFTIPSGTSTP